jgi:NhaP-type Na+/H+ or K+/H+ antiporter
MTRIFVTLATADALALAIAFTLGCWSKLTDGLHAHASSVYLLHFLVGLFTAVGTLLTHCLIFTYFLGTGRWVKEVTLAYDLPDGPWHKRTRDLKRLTFPPALAAMLVTIATAAGGAGAQMLAWPWQVHFGLALAALVINLWAFRLEYRNVTENAGILDAVLREVDRIRAEKGVPPSEEALRQAAR